MGFLSLYEGTEEVPIRDHYVVTIKKHLTSFEYDDAKKALTHVQVDEKSEAGVKPDPNVPEYQREIVIAAIVSWNLTDESDNLLPLVPLDAKRASVGRLPESVVTKLYERVQNNDKEPTSLEKATFRESDLGSLETGDGGTAGAPGVLAGGGDVEEVRPDTGSVVEPTAP